MLFFLKSRRTPRSTLFPTRRSSDLMRAREPAEEWQDGGVFSWSLSHWCLTARVIGSRSEEHTSELQSQSNLVCRLLLEKKKAGARLPVLVARDRFQRRLQRRRRGRC